MSQQHTADLPQRLRRAAASCPWRAGQPAPLLSEAADRIEQLEVALAAEREAAEDARAEAMWSRDPEKD